VLEVSRLGGGVIVVDNASDDDSAAITQKYLKSVVRYTRKYLLPPLPGLIICTESYPVWQKEHIA
jgi:hypothetical protein